MNDAERYETVCKAAFDRAKETDTRLEDKLDQIIDLLRGDNSQAGLVERMRIMEAAIIPHLRQRLESIEAVTRRGIWGLIVVGGAFLTQFGAWLWTKIVGP